MHSSVVGASSQLLPALQLVPNRALRQDIGEAMQRKIAALECSEAEQRKVAELWEARLQLACGLVG